MILAIERVLQSPMCLPLHPAPVPPKPRPETKNPLSRSFTDSVGSRRAGLGGLGRPLYGAPEMMSVSIFASTSEEGRSPPWQSHGTISQLLLQHQCAKKSAVAVMLLILQLCTSKADAAMARASNTSVIMTAIMTMATTTTIMTTAIILTTARVMTQWRPR